MNMGTEAGAMPAKVSVRDRPMVTAGLAKDVDDVKKYAAPIHAGTSAGPRLPRPVRVSAPMTSSRPAVATTSPSQMLPPVRTFAEAVTAGSENIRFARIAPAHAPAICTTM